MVTNDSAGPELQVGMEGRKGGSRHVIKGAHHRHWEAIWSLLSLHFSRNSLKMENKCCRGLSFSRELIQFKKIPQYVLRQVSVFVPTEAAEVTLPSRGPQKASLVEVKADNAEQILHTLSIFASPVSLCFLGRPCTKVPQ